MMSVSLKSKDFNARGDTPHSETKRRLTRGIIQGVFAKNLHSFSVFEREKPAYAMNYLDAFAGKGYFGREQPVQHKYDDICYFGTPVIAVDVAIRHLERLEERKVTKGERFPRMNIRGQLLVRKVIRPVRFIFNDFDSDNVLQMEKMVDDRFDLYGWEKVINPSSNVRRGLRSVNYVKDFHREDAPLPEQWRIQVNFTTAKFEDLPLDRLDPNIESAPMFSLLDPTGYAQIPMHQVRKLLGFRREIFINLMVATIKRSMGNSRHAVTLQRFFGEEDWSEDFEDFNYRYISDSELSGVFNTLTEVNESLMKINQFYQARLKEEHRYRQRNRELTTGSFCFRKGRTGPQKGTIYFMVFASADMSNLQKVKSVMMKHTQAKEELSFSDYYPINKLFIADGRKTTDQEEAEAIYAKFRGLEVTLGVVKKFVLEKTPFPYHAKALWYLEKMGLVSVVSTDDGHGKGKQQERRGRSFCYRVSYTHDSLDPRCGNFWVLKFK